MFIKMCVLRGKVLLFSGVIKPTQKDYASFHNLGAGWYHITLFIPIPFNLYIYFWFADRQNE